MRSSSRTSSKWTLVAAGMTALLCISIAGPAHAAEAAAGADKVAGSASETAAAATTESNDMGAASSRAAEPWRTDMSWRADSTDGGLTMVEFGGLQIGIPNGWSVDALQGLEYRWGCGNGETMGLAIYDFRDAESHNITTFLYVNPSSYSLYFEANALINASLLDASQYPGVTVEDLGTIEIGNDTTAYAYGIAAPASSDAYSFVLIYVPFDGGFTRVELSYDSAISDEDKEMLTQVINSISIAPESESAAQ